MPEKLKLKPLPGLVSPWKLRTVPADEAALNEKTIADVKPDDTWKTLELPQQEPRGSWWMDQIRQEGYALSLETLAGKAKRYVGVASWKAEKAGTACLNTGGHIQTVWFNGKKIFQVGEWNGYHAGTHRIPIDVVAGENQIVIETGAQFALNVTAEVVW